MGDWEGVRLHVVTGKGGTGKTTAAAALAIALATGGHRVLVAEVEGRQGLAQLFETAPLEYDERRVAAAPGDGAVFGLAVDPREAMSEYLAMYYRLGRAGRALDRLGFVEFATTIAPGLRDVLLTGKTYEAVNRRDRGGYAYDAVVLDAPPTGRITRFLDVNASVSALARMGPINRHASSIVSLIHSPRTVVHVVTVLEEMPVQETVDAVDELRRADIPVGAVIVNQVRAPHLRARDLAPARRGQLDRAEIAAGLHAAGLTSDDGVIDQLTAEAAYHGDRVMIERKAHSALRGLDRPLYELPRCPAGVDPAALYELADAFVDQGAA